MSTMPASKGYNFIIHCEMIHELKSDFLKSQKDNFQLKNFYTKFDFYNL